MTSRRSAIKTALATMAGVTTIGLATKSAEAEQLPIFAHPQPQPPTYVAPPPDNRSPREVWQEAEDNLNNYVNGIVSDSPQYRGWRRTVNQVSGKIYLRLKDRLVMRGLPVDEQVIGGDTFLVIHGNLYTISRWW